MLDLTLDEQFRGDYSAYVKELDHLSSRRAGRIALNLAMDEHWERIERETVAIHLTERSERGSNERPLPPDPLTK